MRLCSQNTRNGGGGGVVFMSRHKFWPPNVLVPDLILNPVQPGETTPRLLELLTVFGCIV